jgi:hypothetical protein
MLLEEGGGGQHPVDYPVTYMMLVATTPHNAKIEVAGSRARGLAAS